MNTTRMILSMGLKFKLGGFFIIAIVRILPLTHMINARMSDDIPFASKKMAQNSITIT